MHRRATHIMKQFDFSDPPEDRSEPCGEHGVSCPKAPHGPEGGYLHDEDDDRPYDVDGVSYCGRCHFFL